MTSFELTFVDADKVTILLPKEKPKAQWERAKKAVELYFAEPPVQCVPETTKPEP